MRPKFISDEQITKWTEELKNDENIPEVILTSPILKEVCFAGIYLSEQLEILSCDEELAMRMQYLAGKQSYSNDPWEIHLNILEKYKNNKLLIE